MSNSPQTSDSGLDRVIDDDTPRREALDWAIAQLTAGQTFEHVAAALAAAGWDPEPAAEILEQARQQTRHLRGALTRDQVAAAAGRHYRRAMRPGWFVGFPTAAAVMRLLHSLGSLMTLRRLRRK